MKRMLVGILERLSPRALWRHRIKSWGITTGEAEEAILPAVCRGAKMSVDIGAADGSYTLHMLVHSARVLAFEPRPEAAERLRNLLRNNSLVQIEQCALSDKEGHTDLKMPRDRPMLSTVEPGNDLAGSLECVEVRVELRRLDSFQLRNVGFIKIDVEGHELAVLRGAAETLQREHPVLLIEIEDRHHPGSLNEVAAFLSQFGYQGAFLLEGAVTPLENFRKEVHQAETNLTDRGHKVGCYINNFLFLPAGSGDLGLPQAGRSVSRAAAH